MDEGAYAALGAAAAAAAATEAPARLPGHAEGGPAGHAAGQPAAQAVVGVEAHAAAAAAAQRDLALARDEGRVGAGGAAAPAAVARVVGLALVLLGLALGPVHFQRAQAAVERHLPLQGPDGGLAGGARVHEHEGRALGLARLRPDHHPHALHLAVLAEELLQVGLGGGGRQLAHEQLVLQPVLLPIGIAGLARLHLAREEESPMCFCNRSVSIWTAAVLYESTSPGSSHFEVFH
mmetsp:Transcript_22132/g.34773  ORF Transcript_22132/g.34773 Transcript_22132/m.34773 type:complete len:235 (+) Transcript_22132:1-705(+)